MEICRLHYRSGDRGDVCVLWDQFKPDNLPDGAITAIDGDGGGECERLDGRCVDATSLWSFRRRRFSRTIPWSDGLGLLTLSAVLPSFNPPNCQDNNSSSSCPPGLQIIIFFYSLYLVAFAQGGTKPCTQAFGADQFDARDPKECTS